MTNIELVVTAYLGAGCFTTGYLYADKDFGKGLDFFLYLVVCILIAFPMMVFAEIRCRWPYVRTYFHLYFWFSFWFTQKWDHLTPDEIDGLKYRYSIWSKKDTSRAKIFRYVMRLIFKRNGVTDFSSDKNLPHGTP